MFRLNLRRIAGFLCVIVHRNNSFLEGAFSFAFGMPAEAAAFALGVEPLVSLFRMTINVIGDIAVRYLSSTAIASRENLLDTKIYNS